LIFPLLKRSHDIAADGPDRMSVVGTSRHFAAMQSLVASGIADIEQAEPMSSRLARCKSRTLSARDIGIYGPLVAAEIARVWRLFRWPKFAFKPTGNLGGLEGIKPFALFASERARSHAAGSQSEAHQRPALGASYGSGGLLHSGNLEIPEAACPCQKIRLRYKIISSRSGQGGTCVQFIT
jgi:hypothetical protein